MIYQIKKILRKIAPFFLYNFYHWFWAFFSALFFGFPSRKIKVVAITGTKGKTTVAEIINDILMKAGFKTALASSLRFKIGDKSYKNILKMTMPGRGKIQKLLKEAVEGKCDWFILEATSEGIAQFRHAFIDFDAVVFTNLAPEHIESHGSFEKYRAAKGKIFSLRSRKNKIHIINIDDNNADYFLNFNANRKIGYGISGKQDKKIQDNLLSEKIQASGFVNKENGMEFDIDKEKFYSPLSGEFNLYNNLSAIIFAKSQNIDINIIKNAIGEFGGVKGRMQPIDAGQPFRVIIDYAHTPDSLLSVYKNLKSLIKNNAKMVCVLGAAGGGRDKWKRKEMGKIAFEYCNEIILTNEDPYDEDPQEIIRQILSGYTVSEENWKNPSYVILDRKEAIKKAFDLAKAEDVVIITGKGSESWIMEAKGRKIPWDEEGVVRDLLKK